MKVFLVSINGKTENKAFTSLKGICQFSGISYSSANRGKRIFVKKDTVIILTDADLIKIKGRENNNKSKKHG